MRLLLSSADDQAAFAMAYHDVSWGIIERLVSSGEIENPPPFRRNGNDVPTDLRGVFALTEAYPPFMDMVRAAIQGL